jgi:general nucleoside transport system permease protein
MSMGASASVATASAEAPESLARLALISLVRFVEALVVPAAAVLVSFALFGVFIALTGNSPLDVYSEMYRGAFGTWFSFQNTLLRAAPLMLTGLCTALPARLGLIVIGGEGALVVGGVAAAALGPALSASSPAVITLGMAFVGMLAGGLWIGLAGFLRVWRGVNETISSLLLSYIGIALLNHLVEGPLKDPQSLNKPSTVHIGEANMLASVPGLDVHLGLVFGVVACVACWVLMDRTTFGFAGRIVGGNVRAARLTGLGVGRLVIVTCFLGGAAAGLAGMVEVAAVHGKANASLVCGYGYAGILVAFLSRQNPLAIIPVALLLGGITASGGLLQRAFSLPDAAVSVLQGILFVVLLASETYQGKLRLLPRALGGG